jgi:hypothetical protein
MKNAIGHLSTEGESIVEIGEDEKYVLQFLRALCETVGPQSELFFELIENLKIEFFIMRTFVAALFVIPSLVNLFKKLEIQFNDSMMDQLSLRMTDRFILKEAEKIVGVSESVTDQFIHSNAPLSMRMFLDYAVAVKDSKKDVSPEKLVFATYLGFTIMKEIDTFTALLTSLSIGGDYIALCDLYYEKVETPEIDYLHEAADIMQGREICGVSLLPNGNYVIRKIPYERSFSLSPSFSFLIDSAIAMQQEGTPGEREDSESVDDGSGA